jgi:hypothetical protein
MFAHIISFLRIQDTSTIMKLSVAILSLCVLGNALHSCNASSLRALRKLEETAPSVDTNSVETMESMDEDETMDESSEEAESTLADTGGESSSDSADSSSTSSSSSSEDGDMQLLASALQSSGALSTSRGSFVVAGLGVAAAICAF